MRSDWGRWLEVTEAAACAAFSWVGRGESDAADEAATRAMREAMGKIAVAGEIVIGEGERDEAPMLWIGEKVGTGEGEAVDIAVDPLEGTTITAKGGAGALAVLAVGKRGSLLHAPDVYMEKIAVGAGVSSRVGAGVVHLDAKIEENVEAVAGALGVGCREVKVCVLERPRHEKMIAAVRRTGAQVRLIGDGDVAAVLQTVEGFGDVDMYVGTGGAPEGVLAAAALQCVGGWMQGRLVLGDEEARARAMGVEDPMKIYEVDELAGKGVLFVASGVTDGPLLAGVRRAGDGFEVSSLVLGEAGVRRYCRRAG